MYITFVYPHQISFDILLLCILCRDLNWRMGQRLFVRAIKAAKRQVEADFLLSTLNLIGKQKLLMIILHR